jgi:hypothetical protein
MIPTQTFFQLCGYDPVLKKLFTFASEDLMGGTTHANIYIIIYFLTDNNLAYGRSKLFVLAYFVG